MEGTILEAVFAVFSAIAEWFVEVLPVISTLFYANGALTLLGVLGIAGLAISVVFLLIGVIQNFLHFRG